MESQNICRTCLEICDSDEKLFDPHIKIDVSSDVPILLSEMLNITTSLEVSIVVIKIRFLKISNIYAAIY